MAAPRFFWSLIGYQAVFLSAAVAFLAVQVLAPPERPSLFGPLERGAPLVSRAIPETMPLEQFPKWFSVMERAWAQDAASGQACDAMLGRSCQFERWNAFLGGLRGRSVLTQIDQVNRFVNKVRYRTDKAVWGSDDYWAAPGEFFASGGDCEDFAIAKYYSLRTLGVPAERMRIVVLYDTKRKTAHAVLAINLGRRELLLDSLQSGLVTWARVPQYRAIYSINELDFRFHFGHNDGWTPSRQI